jgi:hypothetical protein
MEIFDIRLISNNGVVPVFKAILNEIDNFGNFKLKLATFSGATSPMSMLNKVKAKDKSLDEDFKFRIILGACWQSNIFEVYTLEQGCKGVDIATQPTISD